MREVDVPVALAEMLRNHVAGRVGYVFTTRLGRPLSQRNLLRVLHAVAGKGGFHAFRRFRTSVLRKPGVPGDLVRFWLGHARRSLMIAHASYLRTFHSDRIGRNAWGWDFSRAMLGYKISRRLS